jgi:hypothetical protein
VAVCLCVRVRRQVGFFHSDPHPGNLMKMHDTSKGRLALLDFGLVATVKQEEIDTMVSSIVHLANKDYASLVDDFIALNILPADCDRSLVEPLMDKALSPYVKGGGAKRYEEELKKIYGFEESGAVGGFQAMTTDMLTVSEVSDSQPLRSAHEGGFQPPSQDSLPPFDNTLTRTRTLTVRVALFVGWLNSHR